MPDSVSICVIGSGYVGLVAAVCFAEMGHRVVCVDNDEEKVAMLRQGGVPIYEQHLADMLAKHLNRGVDFTSDLSAAVARERGHLHRRRNSTRRRRRGRPLLCRSRRCRDRPLFSDYKVIVEKSTVPVYTNEWIRRVLQRYGVDSQCFDVVSNPEFLREGTAIADFLHPDRIVVGANSDRAAELMRRIYLPLTGGAYYEQPDALPGPLHRDLSGKAPCDLGAECGDHQARVKLFSGAQDFFYQRGSKPG